MEKEFLTMNKAVYDYMLSVSLKESESLRCLRVETAQNPMSVLQITPDQGQFLSWLVKVLGARNILEIGTFTGYSAMCMAEALPPDGQLITCDVSEEWTDIARTHWRDADLSERIELRLGPAIESMQAMLTSGMQQHFDLVFIDADKGNYSNYFDLGMQLVRTGGLILIDNTLWKGRVADEEVQDADTNAIRELNTHVFGSDQVDISVNAIGDGLTLIRKR